MVASGSVLGTSLLFHMQGLASKWYRSTSRLGKLILVGDVTLVSALRMRELPWPLRKLCLDELVWLVPRFTLRRAFCALFVTVAASLNLNRKVKS